MKRAKGFLYGWCSKNKYKSPSYDVIPVGDKQNERFLCEMTVPGFDYVAIGHSTSKKGAQINAAVNFLMFLIRAEKLPASEVPDEVLQYVQSDTLSNNPDGGPAALKLNESNQNYPVCNSYIPYIEISTPDFMSRVENQQTTEEAEDLAGIHGNWTLENSKSKLYNFFQMNKINTEFKFCKVGPDYRRSYLCELEVYIKQSGRTLYAREFGCNQSMASKACACSVVRQLYHLQLIEAYTGTTKKSDLDRLEPYEVTVYPRVMQDVENFLQEIGVCPKEVPENYIGTEPITLTLEKNVETHKEFHPRTIVVVSWSPPQPNWNPWTGWNIEEGPLATMSLSALSGQLKIEYDNKMENDVSLKKMLEMRKELPVFQFKDEILHAIQNNSVVIIRGATGCGKSTQVPQYILDYYLSAGLGAHCGIVVTQTRCISAVSVAERIAEERGEHLGNTTGYSVRFESCLPRPYGSILFCTVGVLLLKLESGLRGVSHVIVDDIHERDLNTDFIMILLRDMVRAFPQMHVILMSATIDTTLFQKYFGNCPVIEVPSQTFYVQEYFLEDCIQMLNFDPPPPTEADDIDENMNKVISPNYSASTKEAMAKLNEHDISFELIEALLKYIKGLKVSGAVLVFLPCWNAIFTLMQHLQQHPVFGENEYCIFPLHSQILREDQRKVFEPVPSGVTKIILATNVAETSITINDVVYVIDSCKVEMTFFTSHASMANYATVWASKTNLEQRKGRAGRVRLGFAFRLCSRARFEKLDNCSPPEMFCTPLHKIALVIKLLRLGDVGKFLSKALEPPPVVAVIESEGLLKEMRALDRSSELTPLGKILARLPIEPRLGKMLVLACIFYSGDPLCTVVAHSSTLCEPFDTPFQKRHAYIHREFCEDRWSDHLIMLNAFMQWENEDIQGRFSLNVSALQTIRDARNHLKDLLINAGFPESTLEPQAYHFKRFDGRFDERLDLVVALLCMGFYPKFCFHKEKQNIITIEGRVAVINNLSVNSTNAPCSTFPSPFFVFGEMIHTGAISCKQMTMITPLHLLLFGCKKVEYINHMVYIDRWIKLKMSANDAAKIVALQPIVEDLIMRIADNPETLTELGPQDSRLVQLIKKLCTIKAGKFGSEDQSGATSSVKKKKKKRKRTCSAHRDNKSVGQFRRGSKQGSYRSLSGRGGGYGCKGSAFGSQGYDNDSSSN